MLYPLDDAAAPHDLREDIAYFEAQADAAWADGAGDFADRCYWLDRAYDARRDLEDLERRLAAIDAVLDECEARGLALA